MDRNIPSKELGVLVSALHESVNAVHDRQTVFHALELDPSIVSDIEKDAQYYLNEASSIEFTLWLINTVYSLDYLEEDYLQKAVQLIVGLDSTRFEGESKTKIESVLADLGRNIDFFEDETLYVTELSLEDIRCFNNITINFGESKPKMWTVILGDNGTGKSTILRSLALMLSDSRIGSLMLEEGARNFGPWERNEVKDNEENLSFPKIKMLFNDGSSKGRGSPFAMADSSLQVINQSRTLTDTPTLFEADDFFNKHLFVCGYGAGRNIFGDRSFKSYDTYESTLSLFNYNAPLQNPELAIRRFANSASNIVRWIENILMLEPNSVTLGNTGLEINGPWGNVDTSGALGDGYRATLAWVMDFIGWALMRSEGKPIREVKGIVLVDEIEKHLHPLWQRRIFKLLSEQFPKVQFIVTTHSPLCVLGTTDFEDDEINICLLRRNDEDNTVEAINNIPPPRGKRVDQVLTSYLFEMETTSDDKTKQQIERYSKLLGKDSRNELTDFEKQELQKLSQTLDATLGSEETELGRSVASNLESVTHNLMRSMDTNDLPDAAVFEAKRQMLKGDDW